MTSIPCSFHNPTCRSICFNDKSSIGDPSAGSYVKIYVWFAAPHKISNKEKKGQYRPKCKTDGGHIALHVSNGSDTEYLGWWPDKWKVNRGLTVRISSGKTFRKVRENFNSVPGRSSDFLKFADANLKTSPNKVDGILARNKAVPESIEELGSYDKESWIECPPDRQYDASGLNIGRIINHIRDFKANCELEKNYYQYFTNNCATVTHRALNAGGAGIAPPWICSPRLLDRFLRNHST